MFKKNESNFFTVKKNNVCFILALLVMCIHISSVSNYSIQTDVGKLAWFISEFMKSAANVAVPLFFIISGALFYRNYKIGDTIKKYKSRISSLVIPYIVWNTIWTVYRLICSYTPVASLMENREKVDFSVLNLICGIVLHKYSGQLWFVFDLILFTIFCPVIYQIIRNRHIFRIALVGSFFLYCTNYDVAIRILFRIDALIYYLVGAYIGKYHFSEFSKSHNKINGFVYLIGCVAISILFYLEYLPFEIRPIFILVYCFCFWNMFDLFENKSYCAFTNNSFLIYAMHVEIATVISKLLYILMPKADYFAIVNYILTMALTVGSICVFAYVLDKYCPRLKKILSGR